MRANEQDWIQTRWRQEERGSEVPEVCRLDVKVRVGGVWWHRRTPSAGECSLYTSIQSVNQSSKQSSNQSSQQLINQQINQSSKQSINQASKQSINQPINQSINQPTNQSINQPTNQPSNQSINQASNQPINQSTDQPTNQPTNQAINQPNKQAINQPTNQAINQQVSLTCTHQTSSQPVNQSWEWQHQHYSEEPSSSLPKWQRAWCMLASALLNHILAKIHVNWSSFGRNTWQHSTQVTVNCHMWDSSMSHVWQFNVTCVTVQCRTCDSYNKLYFANWQPT